MTIIIAEAGLNFSSYVEARELARKAKECGADIVKYQTHFNWKYPMLDKTDWQLLFNYCKNIGIEFMSTAWSFEAIDFLAQIGMRSWKIPSSECENIEYLERIRNFKPLEVYASSGFGNRPKYRGYFQELYCISKYPTKLSEINFKEGLKERHGYSDHTSGIIAPIIAKYAGAKVIEKHICLKHPCIDDAVSVTPDKFKEMVDIIRELDKPYQEPIIPPEILALKNRVIS